MIKKEFDEMFEKGAVVLGSERERNAAYHPIIFWEGNDGGFLGLMITHSNRDNNMEMKKNYFIENDSGFTFNESKPSYVVPCLFIKPAEWGPYLQVARVSDAGLQFLEENINFSKAVYWEDFIRQ